VKLQRLVVAAAIAAGAAAAALGLTQAQAFDGLFGEAERKLLDYRVRDAARVHGPPRDSSQVVLVLFDALSAAESPVLTPFPRGLLADLIDVVASKGARTIGLDVYLERLYPELDVLGEWDAKLRDAIERAGNVILVGPTTGSDTLRSFPPPHPYFAEVAAGVATADLPTPYETVRDAVLAVHTEHGWVPGFPLALYAHSRGVRVDSLFDAARLGRRLPVPGLPPAYARLPRRSVTHVMPVLFLGPPSRVEADDGAFRSFSAHLVANAGAFLPDAWFQDRIVLLGSGFHAEERFRTPFYEAPDSTGEAYGWTYGVEVHASALENMLTGRYSFPLGTWPAVLMLLGLGLAVSGTTFWRGTGWGAAVALFAVVAVGAVAFTVFNLRYLNVPVVAPTLAVVFAFLGSTSYVSVVEGKDKRRIKSAFSKYVAPDVVEGLVADPSRLKLGGEKREISVLFSDLAGFTSLSETMDPQELLSLLNEYLDAMVDIVHEESGTLDKYIGDAIMALYGAPNSLADHAARACRTAVRMQRRLAELDAMWREQGRPALHMRIGINTGTPVVGNIGGEKRFDYTALGDSVNLAARLEPACKTYGVDIMISEATRVHAGDAIVVRELDLLAVYGKAQPVPVYHLMGLAGDDTGPLADLRRHYHDGLAAYRRRDFDLATSYFRAALELEPADGPSALYLQRCRDYMLNPPPADWDFVERRQIK
jgi:class 3 adenylate cyclase/CHASE2 domain-containing sensor protein